MQCTIFIGPTLNIYSPIARTRFSLMPMYLYTYTLLLLTMKKQAPIRMVKYGYTGPTHAIYVSSKHNFTMTVL